MRLRSSLCLSLVLLGASVIAPGCGGAVAPFPGDAGGGGSSASGSGGTVSSSSGAPIDSGAIDAPIAIDAPVGVCQDQGVPCIASSQCCSGLCEGTDCGSLTTCMPGTKDCCAYCGP